MEAEPQKADPPKRKRRWFQFSLRTLLIGVTLLAVPCAYVGWQAKTVCKRKSLLLFIVDNGGGYYTTEGDEIYFPVGFLPNKGAYFPKPFTMLADRDPRQQPSSIRRWLGDDNIDCIWIPKPVSDTDAARIAAGFPEACVCQDGGEEMQPGRSATHAANGFQ